MATTLTFKGYEILDDGRRLHFVDFDPGAGLPNDIYIVCTDAELAASNTNAALRALVMGKLQRKLVADAVGARLDGFIDQTVTV